MQNFLNQMDILNVKMLSNAYSIYKFRYVRTKGLFVEGGGWAPTGINA